MDEAISDLSEETLEWMRLTPAERWLETLRLWDAYLAMGGSLDPQPDSQSPFDAGEYWAPSKGERQRLRRTR